MKRLILLAVIVFAVSDFCISQVFNLSNDGNSTQLQAKKFSDNLFYGGEFGASFGDYSQVYIAPSIGYRISSMFSTVFMVEYSRAWEKNLNDAEGDQLGYNQFGVRGAIRFSPIRQGYALLEPAYYSYENPVQRTSANNVIYYDKERREVPFIFLGAGVYQPIGNSRAGITAEIKVDLLQNKNSPYKDWAPVYSIGFVYGF